MRATLLEEIVPSGCCSYSSNLSFMLILGVLILYAGPLFSFPTSSFFLVTQPLSGTGWPVVCWDNFIMHYVTQMSFEDKGIKKVIHLTSS